MMELNIGPQHPVAQGFRIKLLIDGEKIVKANVIIGYLHKGVEKIMEDLNYFQGLIFSEKINPFDPFSGSLCYALAIEKLLDIDVPIRAQYIRMILLELSRINSHLFWAGTFLNNLGFYTPSIYILKERKKLNELIKGTGKSFLRIGGIAQDLSSHSIENILDSLKNLEKTIYKIEEMVYKNKIFILRTKNVGVINIDLALELSLTGPVLRACGIAWDIRKAFPYLSYKDFNFKIPVGEKGDSYDRFFVRIEEVKESINIIRQIIKNLPEGEIIFKNFDIIPPKTISHFKLITEGIRINKGEVYMSVESPRGEFGFYIVSKGSSKPHRVRIKSPSFYNLQILEYILPGNSISDLITIIGSIDPSPFEADR